MHGITSTCNTFLESERHPFFAAGRLAAAQVLELNLSRRTPLPDVELNMAVRDVVQMLRDDEAFSRKVLPGALVSEYPTTASLP